MNDVRRFDFDVTGCQVEDTLGGYVDHDDYAKLEAEAQALREQVARSEQHRNDQADLIVSLRTEVAALRARVVVPECPDRGPWRPISNGRRTVVVSDDFTHDAELIVTGDFADGDKHRYAEQFAAWMNARLSGNAVSEGLLRQACAVIRRQLDGCTNPSEDRDAMQVCESILDLLGEGKELEKQED